MRTREFGDVVLVRRPRDKFSGGADTCMEYIVDYINDKGFLLKEYDQVLEDSLFINKQVDTLWIEQGTYLKNLERLSDILKMDTIINNISQLVIHLNDNVLCATPFIEDHYQGTEYDLHKLNELCRIIDRCPCKVYIYVNSHIDYMHLLRYYDKIMVEPVVRVLNPLNNYDKIIKKYSPKSPNRIYKILIANAYYYPFMKVIFDVIMKSEVGKFEWHIAGDSIPNSLMSFRNHCKKRSDIHIHGMLPKDELTELFKECDTYIDASPYQSWSYNDFDAIKYGCNLIHYDTISLPFSEVAIKVQTDFDLSFDNLSNKLFKLINDYPNKSKKIVNKDVVPIDDLYDEYMKNLYKNNDYRRK